MSKKVQIEKINKVTVQQKIFNNLYCILQEKITSPLLFYIFCALKLVSGLCLFSIYRFQPLTSNWSFTNIINNVIFIEDHSEENVKNLSICLIISVLLITYFIASYIETSNKQIKDTMNILAIYLSIVNHAFLQFFLLFGIQSIKVFINTQNILLGIFGLIITILSLSFEITYEKFYVSYSFKIKNLFLKFYDNLILISKLIILGSVIWISISKISIGSIESYALISIILIAQVIKIYIHLYKFQYINETSQEAGTYMDSFIFALHFFIFLSLIYPQSLLSNNLLIGTLLLSIFITYSVIVFKKYIKQSVILMEYKQLKSEFDILIFLRSLYDIVNFPQNTENSLIILVIKKVHIVNCTNRSSCFCRKQLSQIQLFNNIVLQYLTLINQNAKSYGIKLIVTSFKLQTFKLYTTVIHEVRKFNNAELNITQRFGKYWMIQNTILYINNQSKKQNTINIDRIFELEKILKQIEKKIKITSNSMFQKYSYLAKGLCRVSEIQKFCDKELQSLKTVYRLYKENYEKFKKSSDFITVIQIYFTKIVPIYPLINELSKLMSQTTYKMNQKQYMNSEKYSKILYNKNLCVFLSSVVPKQMGIVCKVSNSFESLFGYKKNYIVGDNINKLMTFSMSQEHKLVLRDWVNYGNIKNFGVPLKVFANKKNGHCCQLSAYMKLLPDTKGLKVVVAAFAKNADDYLLLDDKLNVQAMGLHFTNMLGAQSLRQSGRLIFPYLCDVSNKLDFGLTKQVVTEMFIPQWQFQQNSSKLDTSTQHIKSTAQKRILKIVVEIEWTKMRSKKFFVLKFKHLFGITNPTNTNLTNQRQSLDQIGSNNDKNVSESRKLITNDGGSSAMTSNNEGKQYSLIKTTQQLIKNFSNPTQINDNKVKSYSYLLFFALLLGISIISGLQLFFTSGLNSVGEILFADGAVSDNMQLIQFTFNNAMMLKQSENETQRRQSTRTSGFYIQQYLYALQVLDLQFLLKNVTQIKKLKYYEYLKQPTIWKFNKTSSIQIQTNQFMEYYYHLANQARLNGPSQQILYMMQINFPQMKRINHLNLNTYYDMALDLIDLLNIIFIIGMISIIVINALLAFILNKYYYSQYILVVKVLSLYELINKTYNQELRDIYENLATYFSANTVENMNFIPEIQINLKNQKTNFNKTSFIQNKNYYKYIWFFLLFVFLNCFHAFSTSKAKDFFGPAQKMTIQMNQLMDSQNYLLQAYFDLKAYFIVSDLDRDIDSFLDEILIHVQQDQILFNKITKDSIKLFTDYDPSYEKDFLIILITDVCDQVVQLMSDFQVEKCRKMYYNMLQSGVNVAMTFYQRTLQQAIMQFKLAKEITKDSNQYFKQNKFQDIDDMIIYMFKMYQATQERIMISLNKSIKDKMRQSLSWVIVESIIYFLVFSIWIYRIQAQKKNLAWIHGYSLLLPPQILKEDKILLKRVQQQLQINK